jgi:hypothetical protein
MLPLRAIFPFLENYCLFYLVGSSSSLLALRRSDTPGRVLSAGDLGRSRLKKEEEDRSGLNNGIEKIMDKSSRLSCTGALTM